MTGFRILPILAASMVFGLPGAGADTRSQPIGAEVLAVPAFRFEVDWLKLPAGLATGEMVAVAIDRRDHLWVLHRPRSVKDRPASEVAPPILEFDAQGRYLRGFGGPGEGYEWPTTEHSLAVAANGDIWVSGNNRDADHADDMLLVFGGDGRFIRQLGRRGASKGNYDRKNFHAPADIYIDDAAAETYVADGYLNQRVVVLSSKTGQFRRMWGAGGAAPPREAPPTPTSPGNVTVTTPFSGVHGVEQSRDGRIYVSDRLNQRIQAFTKNGRYLSQVFIGRGQKSATTASGITFSKDRAQRYLFVADWGNGAIVVVDRAAMQVIGTIGREGTAPGEFKGPHLIDTDSKGVIYVAEAQGRRVQRLVPAGSVQAADRK